MNKKEGKEKPVGSWRAVHAAVWLIGIAILAVLDWWWPGILVLVAISGLLEAYLRRNVPQSYEEENPSIPESGDVAAPESKVSMPAAATESAFHSVQEHRLELLPQICPNCNAPIRGHMVKWTGAQSADCPYCGTNLPMNKA